MKIRDESLNRPSEFSQMESFDHEQCLKRIQRTSIAGQILILILSILIAFGLFA